MIRKLSAVCCLLACSLFFVVPAFSGEIHEAAKSGDMAKLKEMLDKDISLLYTKDEMGKTPLHWTVGRGQLEAMKLLLDEYKVKVDVRNDNEGTPLHVGASQAQPEAIKILLEHGADINARTKNGSTPLHFAAFKGGKPGHFEAVKILVAHGADVNAKTDAGATPLSMAMSRGNKEIAAFLRSHGAKGAVSRKSARQKRTMSQGQDLMGDE